MATYYVNKSGNDSNNGTTAVLAKLTIQAAINVATNGDNIIVGSGSYNESISFPFGSRNFYADGVVILDGTGKASTQVTFGHNASYTLSFLPHTTGGWWYFLNGEGATIIQNSITNGVLTQNYKNCVFIAKNATNAINITLNSGGGVSTTTISNCVFSGFSSNCYNAIVGQFVVYNNTFYNCANVLRSGTSSTAQIYNNIISNCSSAYVLASLAAGYNITRNQYYNVSSWTYSGTTYNTLSDAKMAGYDINSIMEQPLFENPDSDCFFLKTISTLGYNQGAYPFGKCTGANSSDTTWIDNGSTADNTGWYNPDGNIDKNGTTGFFELVSGVSGVMWSPVYDLGSIQQVYGVNLSVEQTWPTNMIDTTNTDVRPNYQTIEIRGSGNTFSQNDSALTFQEISTELPISVFSGRYIQLRLTFRANDVGA